MLKSSDVSLNNILILLPSVLRSTVTESGEDQCKLHGKLTFSFASNGEIQIGQTGCYGI